jgi:hypothetical protein
LNVVGIEKSRKLHIKVPYGIDADDSYFEGYAYCATTRGKICDATAMCKTMLHAFVDCAGKSSFYMRDDIN